MSKTSIHPTAIVSESAQIGEGVTIGPYCVIGDKAEIGDNTVLKSHVCIEGRVKLGSGCTVSPFVSFGPPQDKKFANDDTSLVIGNNCKIFEHVTMNLGTVEGGGVTTVGDNGHFMVGVHIAHDCHVGNNVIMANNATLGGHVTVGNYAVLGGLSAIHQFVRIGDFAVVGGMSGVESDVIPYGRVKGERAFLAGLNLIGLERNGFSKDDVKVLTKAFKDLFGNAGTLLERREKVAQDYAGHEAVQKIISFAEQDSHFALCQPKKKA